MFSNLLVRVLREVKEVGVQACFSSVSTGSTGEA